MTAKTLPHARIARSATSPRSQRRRRRRRRDHDYEPTEYDARNYGLYVHFIPAYPPFESMYTTLNSSGDNICLRDHLSRGFSSPIIILVFRGF